jgi:biotin carboxyl carrier protein (BCCP)
MLRKFKIKVDGQEYQVEMEEIGAVAPAAPVASTPAGADAMPSPMPGNILRILVNVGDTVSENQPLMILEAMKMENEIVAAKAGVVAGIHVKEGQVVNPGDALITIN